AHSVTRSSKRRSKRASKFVALSWETGQTAAPQPASRIPQLSGSRCSASGIRSGQCCVQVGRRSLLDSVAPSSRTGGPRGGGPYGKNRRSLRGPTDATQTHSRRDQNAGPLSDRLRRREPQLEIPCVGQKVAA